MDHVQVIPMVLDGQQFVPGLGEQLGVRGIPGIESSSQQKQQGQEHQIFDEIPKETHTFFAFL